MIFRALVAGLINSASPSFGQDIHPIHSLQGCFHRRFQYRACLLAGLGAALCLASIGAGAAPALSGFGFARRLI